MIFKIVCVVAGLLFWFGGLIVFNNTRDSGETFDFILGWILWGLFCIFSMPIELLKNIIQGAKEGAIEGANTFKIKDYGSSFSVSNSPTTGTIRGIFIQGFVFLIFGPITLAFKIIGNLATIISCISALRKINSTEE